MKKQKKEVPLIEKESANDKWVKNLYDHSLTEEEKKVMKEKSKIFWNKLGMEYKDELL